MRMYVLSYLGSINTEDIIDYLFINFIDSIHNISLKLYAH